MRKQKQQTLILMGADESEGPVGSQTSRFILLFPSLSCIMANIGNDDISCHTGTNRQVAWVGDHWGLCSPGPSHRNLYGDQLSVRT